MVSTSAFVVEQLINICGIWFICIVIYIRLNYYIYWFELRLILALYIIGFHYLWNPIKFEKTVNRNFFLSTV